MSSAATDADRTALRAAVRDFVAAGEPDWNRAAKELGLFGVGLPESTGGAGGGPLELAVVHEEFGRALIGGSFFATTALAGPALLAAGDTELLPRIAAGDITATLALDAAVTAERGAGTWRLTGRCDRVLSGADADVVLVPTGGKLFALAGDDISSVVALSTLDPSRPQARLDLDRAPARLVTTGAGAALASARLQAGVALAAEQVGVAAACLDMAVDYAKARYQFGRVIGSFQAVKHLLVDLATEVELARSAAEEAARAATEDPGRLPLLSAIAQAWCSEALVHVAEENIQVHGGIGVTWEHPAHRYFRRATWAESFLGSPAEHRRTIAQLLAPQASSST